MQEPSQMQGFGPPCPRCGVKTAFMGVQGSIMKDSCVEVYMCMQHQERIEGPIIRNKHDNDYRDIDECL
jgi:hypothetical protein